MKTALAFGFLLFNQMALSDVLSGTCYRPSSPPDDGCWQTESSCISGAENRARDSAADRCERIEGSPNIYDVVITNQSVHIIHPGNEYSCSVIIRFSCRL